jgi:hypothetical protein
MQFLVASSVVRMSMCVNDVLQRQILRFQYANYFVRVKAWINYSRLARGIVRYDVREVVAVLLNLPEKHEASTEDCQFNT